MRTFPLTALVLLLSSCELANQLDQLGAVKFDLKRERYVFSTMDPRWKQTPMGGVPQVPCGAGSVTMDCCSFADGSSIDCSATPLSCEMGTCALKFLYTHTKT